jgi:hypothetical protein
MGSKPSRLQPHNHTSARATTYRGHARGDGPSDGCSNGRDDRGDAHDRHDRDGDHGHVLRDRERDGHDLHGDARRDRDDHGLHGRDRHAHARRTHWVKTSSLRQ